MSKDPFRIRDHVGAFDEIVEDIVSRSVQTRKTIPMQADIAYGPSAAETIDLFFPAVIEPAAPVHMFIHGGYWRMFSKRDYSCVADTITAAGAIAVIVDYDLMPAVTMETIVSQIRRAKDWVVNHISGFGGDPSRLSISGHSAGAHLATFLFNDPEISSGIDAALLLGGIYDLKPLQSSFLANEITITDEDMVAFSPMTHRYDPATRATILVGDEETPPFHQQADDFTRVLQKQGLSCSRIDLSGCNHMSSVRDLAIAGTEASSVLTDLIAGPRS